MAHLRNCVLCRSTYDYCPHCDETKPTFHLKYCSENCHNIALIENKYTFKHLTKEEAAMELLKCNVELEKYKENEREYIKSILEAVKTPEPVPDKVEVEVEVEEEKPFYKKSSRRRDKIVNDI